MVDVVGLGCCCFDLLGVVPHMPGPDEELRMLETRQQGGGEVATALVTLARLGCSVACAGKVGDDAFGNSIRRELDRYGVDTRNLMVEPGALSQASVVLVDRSTGQRSILACVPTFSELLPSQLPPGLIEQARVLHLDGVHRAAALAAAGRARRAGVPVVLDADVLALEGDISEVLRRTDVLIASLAFAGSFAKTEDPDRAIDRLLDYGPSVVVVTLGEQGCRGQAEGQRFHHPAFPVEVVDTTGAGDVFHGAYIYGMLQRWELMKTVEFASAVAAIKCTRLGGRTGIPDRQQALRFLRERNSSYFQTDGPEGGQP
ncbi:MAG: PfkB family carbohydrate kinase [Acidobacteriota bacterium]|nr:PfkB family carbohydrate kinase [Acidobacteriota bacterium]